MDDGDPVMEMYKAKAIVIEKEAEIEELRRRIEEFERARQQRNQVWAAISKIEDRLKESNALQEQRVEQSERKLEESMSRIETQKLEETEIIKIINDRLTALEETDKFDRIERKLEEIVTRLEKNEDENVQKGMEEVRMTKKGLLETLWEIWGDRKKKENETILIMGGRRDGEDLDEMVILDRKTSTWKKLNLKLPCKNNSGGCALLNGEIYICGGIELKKKLYKLDSQLMTWIELAEMKEDRRDINSSFLVVQGCIWVFGGWNEKAIAGLNTVEKYCPERNEWIQMPGMSEKRSWGAATLCNGKMFVSGGYNGETLKSMECFDPTSGVWSPMVDMPGDRYGHSIISDDSSLCILGGFGGKSNINTVWKIRPGEDNAAWEELQPMNESRTWITAKSLCCSTQDYKKEIYAIGGRNGKKYLDSMEIFDGERWRDGPKLPNTCSSMSSVLFASERLSAPPFDWNNSAPPYMTDRGKEAFDAGVLGLASSSVE